MTAPAGNPGYNPGRIIAEGLNRTGDKELSELDQDDRDLVTQLLQKTAEESELRDRVADLQSRMVEHGVSCEDLTRVLIFCASVYHKMQRRS